MDIYIGRLCLQMFIIAMSIDVWSLDSGMNRRAGIYIYDSRSKAPIDQLTVGIRPGNHSKYRERAISSLKKKKPSA